MKPLARPLALGPFELIAPIAHGGMGEVWRGRHRASQLPVAIKVITGSQDAAQFRSEVRNAARLAHPHVVMVFDQGEIDANTAAASGGQLEAGLPYLAMEMASGGTLAEARIRKFDELALMLGEILAALSHAHARGVIHRDLKPANVLLAGEDDERPGLKLSDFGIARAMRGERLEEHSKNVFGTLRYMAPEQILGRYRDEGPWSDLYALGAMTYQLATGAPMFGKTSGRELAHSHINVPPPPLRCRAPMPSGLQEWLDKLLAKRPADRFELASDALEALAALGPPKVERIRTNPGRERRDADGTPSGCSAPQLETQIPSTWEPVEEAPPPPLRLQGAGLGLWGLRPISFVGRRDERDTMWTALGKVVATERARLVLLGGSAGVGKSRLCDWLCERAHETGVARSVRTVHSPIAASSDGLSQLVRATLRTEGLGRELCRERALRMVASNPLRGDRAEYEASALTELAVSEDDGEAADRVRFTSPEERYQVVRRLMQRQTLVRPLIVWLDDIQWGGDAIRFIASVLQKDLAVLFVATARTGASALEEMRGKRGFTEIQVDPLAARERGELAHRLLGLTGELTAEVAERTDGNPLFAIQLVGDWVRRGVLRAGASGFELEPGASTEIPPDIAGLWITRIESLGAAVAKETSQDFDATLVALEIAAALGQNVNRREWEAACAAAKLEASRELVEQMLTDGFASSSNEGWEFAHGLFRESLERRAREANRWHDHHRACARALPTLYAETSPDVAARAGRHLREAGELEAALPYLLAGAEAYRLAGDHTLSHALQDERDAALRALAASPTDRRWIEGAIKRAATFQQEGRVEEAIECLSIGTWAAIEEKHEDLVARAETIRGRIHFDMGSPARARESYERAMMLFEKLDDDSGLVACLNGLGSVCMWMRDLEAATKHLEAARVRAEKRGDLLELGQTLRSLAHVRHCDRDYELAAELYLRARGCFEHVGCRIEVANSINDLGELLRSTGDLDAAERNYRDAASIFGALGSPALSTANYNLGLVLLERGDIELAQHLFRRQLAQLEGRVRSVDRFWIEAALLACAARTHDWEGWERHIGEVEQLAKSTGFIDEDIAELAVKTGNLTATAGEFARARRVYLVARAQLLKMEHSDRIEQLDTALRSLEELEASAASHRES